MKERKIGMKEWMKNKFLPWLKAAGLRAVRTMAQTAVASIGTTTMTLGEVNWAMAASAAIPHRWEERTVLRWAKRYSACFK